VAALNRRLEAVWPALREDFQAKALPLDRLRAAFDAVHVVIDPLGLGIDSAFYREAVRGARALRDRFTMLDLAADSGLLEPFIASCLTGPGE
jgi:glycerol-1-phosphate dehydrogenase [NAD(P)+]